MGVPLRNRALYALPPAVNGPRGARAGYREPLAAPWRYLRQGKQLSWLKVRLPGRGRYAAYQPMGPLLVESASKRPLFLIAVGAQPKQLGGSPPRRVYRSPAYYLANAVRRLDGTGQFPFPVEYLLSWAWQRWECGVVHREGKRGPGIREELWWGPGTVWSNVPRVV